MFDIGFFELMIIGVVILVVIGPERMPAFARTAGNLLGRARRMVSEVKQEIQTEIKADELREIINKQSQIPGLDEIVEIQQPSRTSAKQTQDPGLSKYLPTDNDQSK